MKILITAGPTREYIDDVRFLSNASSGRMGYSLAAAAIRLGHQVVLVTGPVELPAGGLRSTLHRNYRSAPTGMRPAVPAV